MKTWIRGAVTLALFCAGAAAFGSEAELKLPDLGGSNTFPALGGLTGTQLMLIGLVVCAIGGIFGLIQYQTDSGPAGA